MLLDTLRADVLHFCPVTPPHGNASGVFAFLRQERTVNNSTILHQLHSFQEHIMSALTDLTAAVEANTAAVTAAVHAIQVLNAQVQNPPAAGPVAGIPDADIAALAAQVTADAERLQQALAPVPQDFSSASSGSTSSTFAAG